MGWLSSGALALISLAVIHPLTAQAQNRPPDVLQRADAMAEQVELLREADGLPATPPAPDATSDRRPRHVLQQARLVYERVAMLRWLNGLNTDDLPPVPMREITPGDVMTVVQTTLDELIELAAVYRVDAVTDLPPADADAAPADVLAALTGVEYALADLGLPAIVPNDVFRPARATRDRAIALVEHFDLEVAHAPRASGNETPSDVFAATLDLLDTLQRLNAALEAGLPGDVAVESPMTGAVTPNDAVHVINLALADLTGLSVAAGMDQVPEYPPEQSGRTPSNVYGQIVHARVVLDELIAHVEGAN